MGGPGLTGSGSTGLGSAWPRFCFPPGLPSQPATRVPKWPPAPLRTGRRVQSESWGGQGKRLIGPGRSGGRRTRRTRHPLSPHSQTRPAETHQTLPGLDTQSPRARAPQAHPQVSPQDARRNGGSRRTQGRTDRQSDPEPSRQDHPFPPSYFSNRGICTTHPTPPQANP